MSETEHKETLDFLLARICHLHRTRVFQLFDALGLYRGQPPVLFELWKEEGLTQSELASRLNIAPATVTRMLQRMEKNGFIRREADVADQRITRVFVTPAGNAVQSQVEGIWKTLEAETFATLSEDELEILRGLLARIRKNLAQVNGGEEIV